MLIDSDERPTTNDQRPIRRFRQIRHRLPVQESPERQQLASGQGRARTTFALPHLNSADNSVALAACLADNLPGRDRCRRPECSSPTRAQASTAAQVRPTSRLSAGRRHNVTLSVDGNLRPGGLPRNPSQDARQRTVEGDRHSHRPHHDTLPKTSALGCRGTSFVTSAEALADLGGAAEEPMCRSSAVTSAAFNGSPAKGLVRGWGQAVGRSRLGIASVAASTDWLQRGQQSSQSRLTRRTSCPYMWYTYGPGSVASTPAALG